MDMHDRFRDEMKPNYTCKHKKAMYDLKTIYFILS